MILYIKPVASLLFAGLLIASPTKQSTPESPVGINLKLITDELSHPTVFAVEPGGKSQRIFICEQEGRIRIIDNGKLRPEPFLDISREVVKNSGYDERGLLGLAFHPDFAINGKFYVYCSAPVPRTEGVNNQQQIREYTVSKNTGQVDPATMRIVLKVDDPDPSHNGGDLKFGPDGYLYIPIGDGGGQHDLHGQIGNGQDLSSLMGKILRIDVNQQPYGIPKDNPFAGKKTADGRPAMPEIFAYGFRNPWRISFDRKTGQLFAGEVGQDKFEEINLIKKGANYGWRIREGMHIHNATDPAPGNLVDPISEYSHSEGLSVTGGYVYRGKAIPGLVGKYIFADWTGPVWQLTNSGEKTWNRKKLPISREVGYWHVYSFGEDQHGELYMLTVHLESGKGAVYKIVP
ncbi:Glucose/arabinose dehydrogenase, beta-propeller fold [Dyadobacter soli]|uniref:Glucose/arabinose dehydrogenase, beta-propeller fold n=1 Tax=Dyadobacter soli TaxID=659014 RepID=A0A1G7VM45_9BACT|nr:PQQ-dependent sugar dehydrogenase [Dyadobacter soli]SDG60489.1 Glucose/arabinose dehydrogenase, beta-propeller fold [Dyadobacter soli]